MGMQQNLNITLADLESMTLAIKKLNQVDLDVGSVTVGNFYLTVVRRAPVDQRDSATYVITRIERTDRRPLVGVTR